MSNVTIRVPKILYKKLFLLKEEAGFGDKSLLDYLNYIAKEMKLNPLMRDNIRDATKILLPMWMNNFSDNLPFIRFGNNLKLKVKSYESSNLADIAEEKVPDEEHPPQGSAIVIGRGPSLFKHNHLKLLAESNYKGMICASDGILITCLEHGIIPDLVTTVDGSPIIKKWFDHPLVKKHAKQLKIVLSATVNHEVYKMLRDFGAKIYWFYPMFDDWRNIQNFTKMQRIMTTSSYNKKPLQTAMAGGNTGTCSWVMAVSLFKRAPVALIGIDFGYPEGTNLEDTPYWSGLAPYGPHVIPVAYKEFYHPIFKTKALADGPFMDYRETFISFQRQVPTWFRHYGGSINCSEGGTLFGPNITCMRFSEFLEKHRK